MAHATAEPPSSKAKRPERPVFSIAQTPGDLSRSPDDGWVPAEPWPMGRRTLRALRGVVCAICPVVDGPGDPEVLDRVERQIRLMLRYMPRGAAYLLTFLVRVFDWSPLWRFKGRRRLHKLSPEEAGRVMRGIMDSRSDLLRNLFFPIRGVIQSVYYDQPEVQAAVGYTPARFMRERIDLRERLVGGEEASREDHLKYGGHGGET